MRALRATLTQQPQGPLVVDWGNPLARGLLWVTADPTILSRAARPSPIGKVFEPAATQVTGPSVASGRLSDVTLLSFGVLNGTANAGNQQGGIRLISTNARLHEFTGNANVSANVQYSDFSNTTIASTVHGVSVTGGVLALGLRHTRGATDGVALFVNGKVLATANAQNKALVPSAGNVTAHWAQASGNQGYLTAFNAIWSRALSDSEIASLSANPWQLFSPPNRLGWVFDVPGSGGGNVTVSISGLSSGVSLGSLAVSLSKGITGSLASSQVGSGTPGISKAITGNQATAGVGSVATAISVAISGLAANGFAGTVTAGVAGGNVTVSATGASVTTSAGSVVPALSLSASGVSFSTAAGSVGSSRTITLSGLQGSAQAGTVSTTGGLVLLPQRGIRKTRYTPGRVPGQLSELVRFLQSEIERINDGLESPFTHQLLEQLNVEPARKPGTQALIAYADGTNWNPGSGEGVYAYYAGSWKKLG